MVLVLLTLGSSHPLLVVADSEHTYLPNGWTICARTFSYILGHQCTPQLAYFLYLYRNICITLCHQHSGDIGPFPVPHVLSHCHAPSSSSPTASTDISLTTVLFKPALFLRTQCMIIIILYVHIGSKWWSSFSTKQRLRQFHLSLNLVSGIGIPDDKYVVVLWCGGKVSSICRPMHGIYFGKVTLNALQDRMVMQGRALTSVAIVCYVWKSRWKASVPTLLNRCSRHIQIYPMEGRGWGIMCNL